MKPTNQRFIIIQLVSLITLLMFASLGTWQLGRGNIKSDIEKASINKDKETVQATLPKENIEEWRYRNLKLYGMYNSEKQFLLDNQVRDRISGYNVLTPLYIEAEKKWVLVDRGWIPQGLDRNVLPDIDINQEGLESISSSIYVPYDKAYSLGGIADGEDTGWPRRIQFVDYKLLSDRLGVPLQPYTLRLLQSENHGYRRDWTEYNMSAQKHYGYAFQWYAMAIAVVILWWLYSIKPLVMKK